MKLLPLTLLCTALPLTAQTTARPAPHHAPAATHRCATEAALPALAPSIPKTTGCPVTLYSLHVLDTQTGTGPLAQPKQFYTVHYTGYLTNGTIFDSSHNKDESGKPRAPITFQQGMRKVIAGWDTGFEGMRVGGRRRLYIPWQLAYGELGRAPIPPRADLIFDIELLGVSDTPKP